MKHAAKKKRVKANNEGMLLTLRCQKWMCTVSLPSSSSPNMSQSPCLASPHVLTGFPCHKLNGSHTADIFYCGDITLKGKGRKLLMSDVFLDFRTEDIISASVSYPAMQGRGDDRGV